MSHDIGPVASIIPHTIAARDAHAGMNVALLVGTRAEIPDLFEELSQVVPFMRASKTKGNEYFLYPSGGQLLIQTAGTDMRGYSLDRVYIAHGVRLRPSEEADLYTATATSTLDGNRIIYL